jgi:ABC-type antimicrobial peptide transport system permease subunit
MAYPLIIIVSGAIMAFHLYFLISNASVKYHGNRLLFAIFILCTMIVSLMNIGTGTRFTFFLYPILLLLTIVSIKQLSEKFLRAGFTARIATLCIFISIFVVSKDFNLNHVLNIDSPEINFRKAYDRQLTGHYIMRRNYKTVAGLIEDNAKEGDLVVSAHQTVHYYTKKVNYILFGFKNGHFNDYTSCNGEKDSWTKVDLIYTTKQLFNLIEHSKNDIWIIINIANPRYDEAEVLKRYKDKLFFTANDGILGVFRLDKAAKNARIGSRDQ